MPVGHPYICTNNDSQIDSYTINTIAIKSKTTSELGSSMI